MLHACVKFIMCFNGFISDYRRKVHQVLVNAEIRHTLCVGDVVAHRTTFKNRNVHNAATQQQKCDHVSHLHLDSKA